MSEEVEPEQIVNRFELVITAEAEVIKAEEQQEEE
jgi:hypothetical protein